jgi:uncharacterized protein YdeI (YjbR/CyaY-like superfamily)
MSVDHVERVEIRSAGELWDLLEARHGDESSLLLVTWKAKRADRYVTRDEVLDALVAFGWTDGRRYKLDDDRTMQLISPRRQQIWAESYKQRAQRLIDEGRMRPPGQAAIDRSKAAGLWDALDHVDALEDPDDLLAALDRHQGATWWATAAPSYRRNVLRWIASAKREPTRAKRIETVASHAARSEKVPNY